MDLQRISHYRVVRRLGLGGMGEVFLAEDTELERSVALKVMSVELAKDLNQRKRFRTEAKAASGLAHPNICVIHEVGETEDGLPFLAMEYVQGHTLNVLMLQTQQQQGRPVDSAIGFVYLGLRDYDKALDALEKDVVRDGLPDEFFCDPFLNEVRNLPRVQAWLKKAEVDRATF